MPIINWIYALERKEKDEEENIRKLAMERMDEVANLRFSINGKAVPFNLSNFRAQSVVPDIVLPDDNIFDMKPGATSIVADGFWVFFQPLVKDLTLETYGSCQSGIIRISGNYHVTISNI
jgi:hypothetical protein